ncbi:glycosyltransferase family 4 protein [Candidatus Microgenomates bacterium]|nr:glycosyltransferase family 4 protein [Candidatus Microgenomates bacterium]
MIIAIDGNEANVEKQVGVSVYTTRLLEYFHKTASDKQRFIIFLKRPVQPHMPLENDYFQYRILTPPFAWSRLALPLYLRSRRDIDVFFTPAHYAPRTGSIPSVVTIHDLSYFYYPDDFLQRDLYKLRNWTEYSIQHAAHLIAVSESTKKDIIKFYSIPDENISVVHNGFEKTTVQNTQQLPHDLDSHPFILMVGTLQPRKNIATVIRAFAKFRKHYRTHKLVIVGKTGWLYDDLFKLTSELDLLDYVIFAGYVADDELASYYKKAFCYVMASFYEGFGIPVLEAMSYDCPVISSNTSSLPEVGGDAALYFDPKSEEDLVKSFIALARDKKLRGLLTERGRDRIKQFSWEQCARQTLSILKKTA